MGEKNYRICLTAPLGARNGSLVLHGSGGRVDGWLNVMGRKNALSGQISDDGQITFSGSFQTLVSTVAYTATGTISGQRILLNLKTDSGAQYPVSGEEFEIDDKIL